MPLFLRFSLHVVLSVCLCSCVSLSHSLNLNINPLDNRCSKQIIHQNLRIITIVIITECKYGTVKSFPSPLLPKLFSLFLSFPQSIVSSYVF